MLLPSNPVRRLTFGVWRLAFGAHRLVRWVAGFLRSFPGVAFFAGNTISAKRRTPNAKRQTPNERISATTLGRDRCDHRGGHCFPFDRFRSRADWCSRQALIESLVRHGWLGLYHSDPSGSGSGANAPHVLQRPELRERDYRFFGAA